jgi:hypothetical protein
MPIQNMTPEEILLATAEQIAAGAKGTDRASKLPGETSAEANARITQGYKDLVAKPVLTPELQDIGAEVKFVRQGAGGVGEYVIVTPFGAKIPADSATQWGVGIIPANSKYITGTTLGMFSMGDGTVTNVGEVPVTTITKAGETSTRSFEGQDAYYTAKVGTTGKTQAQLDAAKGQEQALQFNKDIATLLGGTVDPATGKVTNVAGKTVTSVVPNADGTTTITSSDGTKTNVKTPASAPTAATTATGAVGGGKTEVGRTTNPDGSVLIRYSDGSIVSVPRGGSVGGAGGSSANTMQTKSSTSNPFVPGSAAAAAWDERKSAYDLLYSQFKQYGLEALIAPLQNLITEGVPASEFTIRLRETEAYKKRFAANAQRIAKGLTAISEAEYLGLEDQYQNIMRNYGLPAEYYTRGDMGIQSGFEKFIANDVSAAELEDRVMTAQSRVMNANPEVLASLKAFYPDITNGDILAYTLDPTKGLTDIKRKVTAAEIGGGAMQAGLGITGTRAGELTAAGITKQQAQQGFGTIAGGLERGSQLASIYGENPYTQTTAEQEVFGLAGKTEAEKQRKKLTGLEKATFSGQTGLSSGALVRDRAGAY